MRALSMRGLLMRVSTEEPFQVPTVETLAPTRALTKTNPSRLHPSTRVLALYRPAAAATRHLWAHWLHWPCCSLGAAESHPRETKPLAGNS